MRYLIVALFLLGSTTALSEQARPPWLQDDVLRAAAALELTEAQKPQFRQAVTDLVSNQVAATNKLLRRNNVSNLERKLKTASNRQFKKMDKSMQAFLSEEQFVKYGAYRSALKEQMANASKNRSGTSGDALQGASSALNGYGQTQ